jgi:ATP-dependent RNA helicase DOB1
MKTDLVNMKRVMRRLDLCEKTDVPKLKGKVACSISASDELIATELLFSGVFNNLDSSLIAALCSCLIYTDTKGEDKMPKDDKFVKTF